MDSDSEVAAKVYEIANPSDPVTLKAADPMVACVAVLFLGQGLYGLKGAGGETVMPLHAFGANFEAWFAERGVTDVATYLTDHTEECAVCLESALVCSIGERSALDEVVGHLGADGRRRWNEKRRSSMNDICGAALRMAAALRKKHAETVA